MELRITVLLLLACTLSGADAILQPPRNLHFTSVNTENIFHWSPAQNYSEPVQYDVQYCRYGNNEDFLPVPHCTGISHHHCDLIQETWDFNMTIIARVRTVAGNTTSEWEISEYFKPRDSTSLGLPSFTIKAESNTITVSVSPPTLHAGGRSRTMEEVFGDSLKYIFYIRANTTDKPEEIIRSGELHKTNLQPGTTYCVRVRAILFMHKGDGNITEEKCAVIPTPKLGSLINIIFGIISAVIILFSLCFCLGLSCQYYLKKQSTIPAVLKSLDKNKKHLSIMDYLSLIEDVVVLQVFADSLGPAKIQEQDDLWPDPKIKEASSVDSGIDIGSNSSDRVPTLSEPLHRYLQQTPEPSRHRSSSPESGQDKAQPEESCAVDIPSTVTPPGNGADSISASGYRRQAPRTDAAWEQGGGSVPPPTDQHTAPCSIFISDIDLTQGSSKGFLSLDDVMLTDNGL
uniref:tissue factor-like n=1 Tax=Pristiophorus japonicus TaxID=55135 RepID=UPI00398F6905